MTAEKERENGIVSRAKSGDIPNDEAKHIYLKHLRSNKKNIILYLIKKIGAWAFAGFCVISIFVVILVPLWAQFCPNAVLGAIICLVPFLASLFGLPFLCYIGLLPFKYIKKSFEKINIISKQIKTLKRTVPNAGINNIEELCIGKSNTSKSLFDGYILRFREWAYEEIDVLEYTLDSIKQLPVYGEYKGRIEQIKNALAIGISNCLDASKQDRKTDIFSLERDVCVEIAKIGIDITAEMESALNRDPLPIAPKHVVTEYYPDGNGSYLRLTRSKRQHS